VATHDSRKSSPRSRQKRQTNNAAFCDEPKRALKGRDIIKMSIGGRRFLECADLSALSDRATSRPAPAAASGCLGFAPPRAVGIQSGDKSPHSKLLPAEKHLRIGREFLGQVWDKIAIELTTLRAVRFCER
jgi:hypothetical protein